MASAAPPPTTTTATPGTENSPLPPSIEKAYYRKCIELKRRMTAVEDSNDTMHLRKIRLDRAITKMRLERAILLEKLKEQLDSMGHVSEEDNMPHPEDPHIRHKRPRYTPPPPSSTRPHSIPYEEQMGPYRARSFDNGPYQHMHEPPSRHHPPYQPYGGEPGPYFVPSIGPPLVRSIVPSQRQPVPSYEAGRAESQGWPPERNAQSSEATQGASMGGFTAVNR